MSNTFRTGVADTKPEQYNPDEKLAILLSVLTDIVKEIRLINLHLAVLSNEEFSLDDTEGEI